MNLSKYAILSLSLAFTMGSTVYADQANHPLSAAEKNTLATIATIDKNEILVSIIAQNKKVDSNVVDFAKLMVGQHGSNLAQILEMENQLKTGPLSSGEAEKLATQGKQGLTKLGALQGMEFARAYADAMVMGHEAALKLIDDKLMQTAKSEEMKNFLTDTRTVVEQHLEHAKQLQAQLKS